MTPEIIKWKKVFKTCGHEEGIAISENQDQTINVIVMERYRNLKTYYLKLAKNGKRFE